MENDALKAEQAVRAADKKAKKRLQNRHLVGSTRKRAAALNDIEDSPDEEDLRSGAESDAANDLVDVEGSDTDY